MRIIFDIINPFCDFCLKTTVRRKSSLSAKNIYLYLPVLPVTTRNKKPYLYTVNQYHNPMYSNNTHLQNNFQPNLSNRSYGFKELAVLYFPNIAPASASIRLKQWIKDDVELLDSLDETNYHLSNRILTPKQRDLITTAFGSPF